MSTSEGAGRRPPAEWRSGVAGLALLAAAAAFTGARVPEPALCEDRPATITGSARDDTLVGTPGTDVVLGLDGDDTIAGLGGNDLLCGGGGSDSVDGGLGQDTVSGGPGRDTLRGGPDIDTVSYRDDRRGVTVDLLLGHGGPDLDALSGMENAVGTADDDRLYGGTSENLLVGLDGSDTLSGGFGDDELVDAGTSPAASNRYDGGPGHDVIIGGQAQDVLAAGHPATIAGALVSGVSRGGGQDSLSGIDTVDTCTGGGGADPSVPCP